MKYTRKEVEKLGIKNPAKISTIIKTLFGNRFLYDMDSVDEYGHSVMGFEEYECKKRHVMSEKEWFEEGWLPLSEIYTYFPLSRQRFHQLIKRADCNRHRFAGLWLYQKEWVKQLLNEPKRLIEIERKKLYLKTENGTTYTTFKKWKRVVDSW